MRVGGEKDGLHDCKVCAASGNLYQLKRRLGIASDFTSLKDSTSNQSPDQIPDIGIPNHNLLNNEAYGDDLDYLVAERGISIDVIKKQMIGSVSNQAGAHWLMYPYINAKGVCTYVKYRICPPHEANPRFRGLKGRENPLYNDAVLKAGMSSLFMVEGEIDCLTLLSQGIENVVGIPGAAMKKADWVQKLDKIAPGVIYLLYDNDKPGQDNARDMAGRIGIEKVKNIKLPPFTRRDGEPGKDINEWFMAGHTLAEFYELVDEAAPFDVDGVQSVAEVLEKLIEEFDNNGTKPTLDTPWEALTQKVGGYEWGDLVGILAQAKVGKTTYALNMLDYYARIGYPSFMFCQEMKPTRMVRKWVSHVTRTDDSPNTSKMSSDVVREAMSYIPAYKADLMFGYTRFDKPAEIFETILQAVRRYGTKVVCFDNLQLMCKSTDNIANETSLLTKRFKAMAMELNILMLLIIQPKQVQEGKLVSAFDGYGSSAIPKDVDSMHVLHRNKTGITRENEFCGIMETEESLDPFLYVRADLTRYAPGGSCTLYMDGATSSIREMSKDELMSRPKVDSGGIAVEA